ncbi:hypothetical protein BHM03_00016059 [Ensete ventricosum]|nr:hypothetical protein BHM03_00016059 [Ensete ventricosum]
MRWDLSESSLGDSPKESGSLLGKRREIGGLAARLPEYAGNLGGGQLLMVGKPPILRFFEYDWILALVLKPIWSL